MPRRHHRAAGQDRDRPIGRVPFRPRALEYGLHLAAGYALGLVETFDLGVPRFGPARIDLRSVNPEHSPSMFDLDLPELAADANRPAPDCRLNHEPWCRNAVGIGVDHVGRADRAGQVAQGTPGARGDPCRPVGHEIGRPQRRRRMLPQTFIAVRVQGVRSEGEPARARRVRANHVLVANGFGPELTVQRIAHVLGYVADRAAHFEAVAFKLVDKGVEGVRQALPDPAVEYSQLHAGRAGPLNLERGDGRQESAGGPANLPARVTVGDEREGRAVAHASLNTVETGLAGDIGSDRATHTIGDTADSHDARVHRVYVDRQAVPGFSRGTQVNHATEVCFAG